jgi:16S rRNA (adenine1518-N6/adenine1519-N6)-dimethyltransferase
MTLSEIRRLLNERGIRLTRSLGQSFLHDQNQVRKIAAAAELTRRDQVLEIGPGLGPLTELLLQQAGEVLAIEKDARLVEVLQERFDGSKSSASGPVPSAGLQLVQADALDYLRREPCDWSNWKMVSNLPYSVASPILVELAQNGGGPQRIVATLQIDVVRRLMARAGDADYGLLTLLIQADYEPVDWFRIPAGCFFPEPEVDSGCVSMTKRAGGQLAPVEREIFYKLVRKSFSQRRKMMLKLLKSSWPEARLREAFEQAQVAAQSRAESVTLEQFIRLAKTLTPDSHDG